jgi:hypothetical protein
MSRAEIELVHDSLSSASKTMPGTSGPKSKVSLSPSSDKQKMQKIEGQYKQNKFVENKSKKSVKY